MPVPPAPPGTGSSRPTPVPPDDPLPRACPSAVSSFDTVVWSLETCCSSAETVWSAASQVAWPAGVAVLALVQSDWAWARSAPSFCWSLESVDWSWVSVVWSSVTVALEPPFPPVPLCEGAVVVVVLEVDVDFCGVLEPDAAADWFSSSSTSFASFRIEGGLGGRHRLAQRGGVERAERLPGGHRLPGRRGDRGHLTRHLEGGGGVADRLDVADERQRRPDVGPCDGGDPVARRAAADLGPRRDSTADDEGADDRADHDRPPVAGPAPARRRLRHRYPRRHRRAPGPPGPPPKKAPPPNRPKHPCRCCRRSR